MYIFVKRVWFIMFIYLLVIADKKISHIMCILTILTVNDFLWTIKQNITMKNTFASIVYNVLIVKINDKQNLKWKKFD